MKKQSLEILYRYRTHLLEKEQVNLQDKIAEENQQKVRLLQLQARIQSTQNAKSKAGTVEELRALDEAASYLNGRVTLAKRAVAVATQTREEALDRTLKTKQGRDQLGSLLEKGRRAYLAEMEESERKQMDEVATARFAMGLRTV
jgi:flagellar export protein FliJ